VPNRAYLFLLFEKLEKDEVERVSSQIGCRLFCLPEAVGLMSKADSKAKKYIFCQPGRNFLLDSRDKEASRLTRSTAGCLSDYCSGRGHTNLCTVCVDF
jgi:hypothetical protein